MTDYRGGLAVLFVGIVTLTGCSDGPKMVEVEGTVTVKGKPVDKIQVEFWPEGNGPRSIGVTDEQGRFSLSSDDGKRKGAAVGSHRIVLRDIGILGDEFLGRAAEDIDLTKGKKPRISTEYDEPQKTPLKKEVSGEKTTIDLEVNGYQGK
jgi:hypothetical protein